MESGRIEPPGSSRTSGGTALPPATPVGQIYTMYIDFPLDGNNLNPKNKALPDTPRFSASFQGPPLEGSWPLAAANLRVRALRGHPKWGWKLFGAPPVLDAPQNPWRSLQAAKGAWAPAWRPLHFA